MKANLGTVVFSSLGMCISCLIVVGILFLIGEYVPLSRFYLWCGLSLSTLWSVVSWVTLIESMVEESTHEPLLVGMNCGLAGVSMCSFGYFVFLP